MEIIIILILLIYITFLHYQLLRKKLFINSIVDKLSKMEKSWNKEYVLKILNKLQNINAESMIREDRILHDNILTYLTCNHTCKTFIHYTKEKSTADKIIMEGFKFSESFHKTAEEISSDQIDLIYKHNIRKYFGKYIIIICISKDIISYYESELKKMKNLNFNVEQILTEGPPFMNENQEEIYTCPNRYIKGYLNYESGEILDNTYYDPGYNSMVFKNNLGRIINGFKDSKD